MKHTVQTASGLWMMTLVLISATSARAALDISIQPASSVVAIGDTVELAVHAAGPDSVGWYWVQVRVDDSILAFLDCSMDLLDGCPSGSWCPDCGPTGEAGVVSVCCACFGSHTCLGMPANLTVLRYVATGVGASEVTFDEAHASDCNRVMIPIESVASGSVQAALLSVDPEESRVASREPPIVCYPNPFVSTVTIELSLPRRTGGVQEEPRFSVFDARGRKIRNLIAGTVSARWDGRDEKGRTVPSGIYFCRMEVGRRVAIEKLVKLD